MIEIGGALAGLALVVLVAAHAARDRRKRSREAALLGELREVEAVDRDLWDALGPEHHPQLVCFYLRGRETLVRADYVFEYWNKVGRLYAAGAINRRRFLPLVAAKCNRFWREYADLIRHFHVKDPRLVAPWRRMNAAAERYLKRRPGELEGVGVAA